MTAVTARTQAKQLIDFVPDYKITFIVRYIQSFATKNKVTSHINSVKKAAYEALLADVNPVVGKPLSLNGTEEVADIIFKKYESLN